MTTAMSEAPPRLRLVKSCKTIQEKPQSIGPEIVFEKCRALSVMGQESFVVLYLDEKNRFVDRDTFHTRSLTVREVFRNAIRNDSHSIILVRTELTDNPRTDSDDFRILQMFKNWGNFLEIKLLDYVAVGYEGYFSYREHYSGYWPEESPAVSATVYTPVKREPTPENQRMIDIGQKIQALRIEKGMKKQKDLAEKTGIRQTYLSNIERGNREPSEDEAAKIATALNVNPQDFLLKPTEPAENKSSQSEVTP